MARKLVRNQDLGTETVGVTKSRIEVSKLWAISDLLPVFIQPQAKNGLYIFKCNMDKKGYYICSARTVAPRIEHIASWPTKPKIFVI